jgi:spore coat polysaccharide biosynthesis protein SpsF (cytidylyltransferase family)
MDERNTEPVGTLTHTTPLVIAHDTDYFGIQLSVFGTCYEILKARTASVLGA